MVICRLTFLPARVLKMIAKLTMECGFEDIYKATNTNALRIATGMHSHFCFHPTRVRPRRRVFAHATTPNPKQQPRVLVRAHTHRD